MNYDKTQGTIYKHYYNGHCPLLVRLTVCVHNIRTLISAFMV